jgi:hypothetical protein
VRAYNHELAFQRRRAAGEAIPTEFRTPRSMVASMVSVPLPARCGGTPVAAARCATACCSTTASSSTSRRGDRLAARVAIQIYNDLADVDRLGEAIARR